MTNTMVVTTRHPSAKAARAYYRVLGFTVLDVNQVAPESYAVTLKRVEALQTTPTQLQAHA